MTRGLKGHDCGRYLDAISSRLDDEPVSVSALALDAHLARCPKCRDFEARSIALNRQIRVREAAFVPDRSHSILAAISEASPTAQLANRREPKASSRRRPSRLLFLGAVLALVVAMVGWAGLSSSGSGRRQPPTGARVAGHTGAMTIADPFVPAPPLAQVAAVYFKVRNAGPTADALVSASSGDAQAAVPHGEVRVGRAEEMVPIDRLAVPADSQIDLEPGGVHLMLVGLRRLLRPGDQVAVSLHFAHSGTVTIRAPVISTDTALGLAP